MSQVFKTLFGGGQKSSPAPTVQQAPTSGAAVAGAAPGTSPVDYKRQEEARYQQMLSGLGIGTEGNQLPQGIQQSIDQQAALLK